MTEPNRIFSILLAVTLAVVAIVAAIMPLSAQADDFWNTPTPTSTPGTPTPYPVPPSSTVVATPPMALGLPGVGSYPMPTSIPVLAFPPPPSPIVLDPIPTPSISTTISEDDYFTSTTGFTVSLDTMSSTISLSYTEFVTIGFSGEASGTLAYTTTVSLLDFGTQWISDVMSYTGWLSGEIASLQQTDTFTIATAPAWYAPDLPRPMADIGWTYETELEPGIDTGERYALDNWAWFTGYTASMPFQFIKILWQIFQLLGPLGLFVVWLVVMAPYKLWVVFLIFLKNSAINLFNFAVKVLTFVMDFLRTLAVIFLR